MPAASELLAARAIALWRGELALAARGRERASAWGGRSMPWGNDPPVTGVGEAGRRRGGEGRALRTKLPRIRLYR